jgi:protein TonB
MNKFLLQIFCFLIVLNSFGQSAKKENIRLHSEHAAEVAKHDSLKIVFNQQSGQMTKMRIDAGYLAEDIMSLMRKIHKSTEAINKSAANLKLLGLATDSVSDNVEIELLNKLNVEVQPLRPVFEENFRYESIYEKLELEEQKRKTQNELLKQSIRNYKVKYYVNSKNLEKIESNIKQIDSLILELKKLENNFKNVSENLKEKETENRDKLNTLENDYIKRGPKGFPKDYAVVFPDAFTERTPPKNLAFDGVVEMPGDYEVIGDVDAVPAPKPVPEPARTINEDEIYEFVDEPATFLGGSEAWYAYTKKNLVVPSEFKKLGKSARCYVRFIVSKDGEISNVKLVRGIDNCPECDKEALRLMKNLPLFVPGRINGQNVNSQVSLPIRFETDN